MTFVSLLLLLTAGVSTPSEELIHDSLILSFCRELARDASAQRRLADTVAVKGMAS